MDVEKLSIRAAFAIAYMAAKASEHLTAGPTRPAESQSPSDPALRPLPTRGHPSRGNRTVCSPTQGSLRSIQRTRRRPGQRGTQQAQPPRLPRCARNNRTTHISRRTRRIRSSSPPAEQRTNPQRDNHAHTRQPATTTTPSETPAATLRYLTKHGEEPPMLSRDPCPDGQTEQAPREILGRPAGEGHSSTAPHTCYIKKPVKDILQSSFS